MDIKKTESKPKQVSKNTSLPPLDTKACWLPEQVFVFRPYPK